jgi:histidinol-phosphate aminotransferase
MGLFVYPSHANFVSARCTEPAPAAIAAALKGAGLLIRTFGDPRLQDWVRITLGTPEQNDRVIAEIEQVLVSAKS